MLLLFVVLPLEEDEGGYHDDNAYGECEYLHVFPC
jgi:hypothetical protein